MKCLYIHLSKYSSKYYVLIFVLIEVIVWNKLVMLMC